jgi:hypothetical protein
VGVGTKESMAVRLLHWRSVGGTIQVWRCAHPQIS